jgi:hypothetical protein
MTCRSKFARVSVFVRFYGSVASQPEAEYFDRYGMSNRYKVREVFSGNNCVRFRALFIEESLRPSNETGFSFASSGEFVGDGERQRAASPMNRRNFLQVESKDLCSSSFP